MIMIMVVVVIKVGVEMMVVVVMVVIKGEFVFITRVQCQVYTGNKTGQRRDIHKPNISFIIKR